MDHRRQQLEDWLKNKLILSRVDLQPLTADASFRRYFRLQHQGQTYLAMDSPPELEPCQSYVAIASVLLKAGLTVPIIYHQDQAQGFLLITDFGDELLLQQANQGNAEALYTHAIDELLLLQRCELPKDLSLPHFNADMMGGELGNFNHWFLGVFLQHSLTSAELKVVKESLQWLINEILLQPTTLVHRDYHSRNLMILSNQDIGIIDFQDAVIGPMSYDIVSLLRDCYIDWPTQQVEQWLDYFYQGIKQHHHYVSSFEQLKHEFNLMGMQRHLKACFIFVRKLLRDHDDRYLKDVPRTLNYVAQVVTQYPELQNFATILHQKIIPEFNNLDETRKLVQQ